MRIDAEATKPEFGVLCHLLKRIAGHVRKRPCVKHSYGGAQRASVFTTSAACPLRDG